MNNSIALDEFMYVGEIRAFATKNAPTGWHICDGSALSIADYQALYTAIGTSYGGDGAQTFYIPNLQGYVPVGQGQLAEGSLYTMGATGGITEVQIDINHLPTHTHAFSAVLTTDTNVLKSASKTPNDGSYLCNVLQETESGNELMYGFATGPQAQPNITLGPKSVTAVDWAANPEPHSNFQPFQTVYYFISTEGIFPNL